MARGTEAIQDFQKWNNDNPYVSSALRIGSAEVAEQWELKEKYLSQDS